MLVSKINDKIVYASDLIDVDTSEMQFRCKYCDTEVIIKKGGCPDGLLNCKRPHFAHKDASECALNSQGTAQLDLKQRLINTYRKRSKKRRQIDIDVDVVIADELVDIVLNNQPFQGTKTAIKIINKKWENRHQFEDDCRSEGIHNVIYILTKMYRTTPVFLMDIQRRNGYVYTYDAGKLYNYQYTSGFVVGVGVTRSSCKSVAIGKRSFKNDGWNAEDNAVEYFVFGTDGLAEDNSRWARHGDHEW